MPIKPRFGGPLQAPAYYEAVSSIISVLRDYSTLKTISEHLTAQGFLSPSGKPFNKQRVANFIRSPHYTQNK
ncbi:recombinase family protein [Massilia alkalitolerans]|uniref:recombinase family protein n=1 Tax=Massilia alkalitolerans TaxID=286638 RepID=UPI0028AEBD17|nr:recombinase family protein [Massilia alkalitolerans]